MAANLSRQNETSDDHESKDGDDPYDSELPLIFYCKRCSVIVGDTMSWVCVNKELKALVLRRVTDKVTECNELFMSPSGPDKGSTFVILKCSECSEEIGCMYKSTASHLDELRNFYSLYASKIDSYVFGSAQVGNLDLMKKGDSTVSYCVNQIKKLKMVIVEFNRRMSLIEERLGIDFDTKPEEISDQDINQTGDSINNQYNYTKDRHPTSSSTSSSHKRKLSDISERDKFIRKKNKFF